jgi:hypothetical protein
MHKIILFCFITIINCYEFYHSEGVLINFLWSIDEECMDGCELIVIDKNTNKTVPFSPNTYYLSCEYTSDYQWDIICNNSCVKNETWLYKVTTSELPVKEHFEVIKNHNHEGIIIFDIPPLIRIKNKDCLILEVECSQNAPHSLKYYGKNIGCPNTTFDEIHFTEKTDDQYFAHGAKIGIGYYNDEYYDPNSIRNIDEYYFKIKGDCQIRYKIGNNLEPSSQTTTILIWVLFGILTITAIIMASTHKCKPDNHHDIILNDITSAENSEENIEILTFDENIKNIKTRKLD